MIGWARCNFQKKGTWTHYAELVFLHLVGSVALVLHSATFGAQNVDAQFFMHGWDWNEFYK
jgi:hypothetical protein